MDNKIGCVNHDCELCKRTCTPTTYGSEELMKYRAVIRSQAQIIEKLEAALAEQTVVWGVNRESK